MSVTAKDSSKESRTVSTQEVMFYIPNLIGYLRVATAIISFVLMPKHPIWTLIFYGISGFLDAFDGYAARKFNQGTRYGAVLDMSEAYRYWHPATPSMP
ncbi:hypothetical protein QCA50_015869 [Cerrena zonata]|uniref:Uncharacterized protein n=1 Tax=Cerrena zonata TaxID=2478898 RepID=A0AAW0FP16_9APHY